MALSPAYDVVPQAHQPNDGEVALSAGVLVAVDNQSLALTARGGEAKVKLLEVKILKSAWR